MTESKAHLARLRDEPATLQRLIADAASWLDVSQEFAPKNFWATELLRAIATETHIATPGSGDDSVRVIFKGGTSRSRAYRIIERFSEDIDILVVFPKGSSIGARDKALHGTGMRSPWAGSAGLRATRVHKGSQAQHPISLSARISQPRYERDTAPRDGISGRPLLSSMDTKLNIPLLITRRS